MSPLTPLPQELWDKILVALRGDLNDDDSWLQLVSLWQLARYINHDFQDTAEGLMRETLQQMLLTIDHTQFQGERSIYLASTRLTSY